ncbi:MAG TPA: hypothetical protein VLC09_08980, partial [Polyangiaceae bacterium]|nr:hypothetical protein [Polyangiaceae bacterium]
MHKPHHLSAAPVRRTARPYFSALTALSLVLGSVTALGTLSGCQGAKSPSDHFRELRESGPSSSSGDEVAEWMTLELLTPGGSPKELSRARKRLDELKAQGMVAQLVRALDDQSHGKPRAAGEGFFAALMAARESDDPRAPMVAWVSAQQALELSGQLTDLVQRHGADVDKLLAEPGAIGFRAYATVVDLWGRLASDAAERDVDAAMAQRLGCVPAVHIAGPFGEGGEADSLRHFEAER